MDIDALKSRLAGLQNGGNKSKDIWKPKSKHQIRFVPNPHAEDPFQEVFFHYELTERPIVCPKANYGDDCAACDLADMLKSYNAPDGSKKPDAVKNADWELFRKVQAKARVLVPMVERGKENELAHFWSMTPNQAIDLVGKCADADRLEALGIDKDDTAKMLQVLINPDKAYDVDVQLNKKGENGNTKNFDEVKFDLKIKVSALAATDAEKKAIIASVKKISDVYPKVSSAEVEKIITKYLNSQAPAAKPEGGVEHRAKAPTNSKEDASKKGGRSIDVAFGDLVENKSS